MSHFLRNRIIIVLIAINILQVGTVLIVNANRSHARARRVAVLINNDASQRHVDNIIAAQNACLQFGIEPIVVEGDAGGLPTRKKIIETLNSIPQNNQTLSLLYLTGHGSLLFDGADEPTPSIHFKDGPLAPCDVAIHLKNGATVVYVDVCFAPDWVEKLSKQMTGKVVLLSDKSGDAPQRSCRGVSEALWQNVSQNSQRSIKDAMYSAWRETCPGVMYRN